MATQFDHYIIDDPLCPKVALSQPELLQELTLLLNAQASIKSPDEDSEFYKFINRKTGWQPAQYAQTTFKQTGANTHIALQKAMALALELEVPVGLFTLSASQKDFPDDQRWALLDNSKDELIHYQALSNWANSGAQIDPEYAKVATQFRQQIESLPECEIVKSGYIELGVFFIVLALFRKFGNSSLKLLAQDISRDESVHVRTNWAIIEQQDIPWAFSKLNSIRQDIIHWLTADIRSSSYGYSFWEDQSNRLISTKQAEGLSFTKAGIYTAFFEVPNTDLAAY